MRIFLLISVFLVFASCAKNESEQASEAIDIALTHLSNSECDDAIRVLEDVKGQSANPIYLQVLSSAYACRASFDEISFISTDLAGLDTTSGFTTITSLSVMSLSPETEVDSSNYTSLRTAINLLLNSTSGSPSHSAREEKFGVRRAGDMGMQALILSIVNFGKFLNFYGNVDENGDKGQGSNTNTCFMDYTDPRVTVSAVLTGACTTKTDGHPDLSLAASNLANAKRRLCEGLMLFTNIVDILDNIDTSGSSDLSKLSTVATQVNTIKAAAVTAGLGTLINMTSQSTCETAMNTASNLNDMEYLYSLVFEAGLK